MAILKLNLLPAYLAERRKTLGMTRWMLLLIGVVLGIMIPYVLSVQAKVAVAQDKYDEAHQKAEKVRALEQEIEEIENQHQPYERWVNWMRQVEQQGPRAVRMLEEINKWLFKEIEVQQMAIRGEAITFDGRARNLDAMKRFYLQMKVATPFRGRPQFSYSVDAWSVGNPPDDSKRVPFRFSATLKQAFALRMPAIPPRTITLGGRGVSRQVGSAGGGAGGQLGPATLQVGAGGGASSGGGPDTTGDISF